MCFLIIDRGKYLQTLSLNSSIKTYSASRCICKILIRLLPVSRLWMTQLQLGVFTKFFWKVSWENSTFISQTRIRHTLCQDQYTDLIYLAEFFLECPVLHTKVLKKSKHILFSVNLFSKNLAINDIMSKNTLGMDSSQLTGWSVSIACCIPRATNIHFWNM